MNDSAATIRLTGGQRRQLRGFAHGLDPVVQLGQRGLTSAVQQEIERALADHELIKVRLVGTRADKDEQVRQIESDLAVCVVQRIGHLAVLYRPHPEGGPVSDRLIER